MTSCVQAGGPHMAITPPDGAEVPRPAGVSAPTSGAGVTGVSAPRVRDHRVDALRGVALLMMCIDHIPQDVLNRFTMRNVGFADAAEVFVLLAGYASWLAYGRAFSRQPWQGVVERIVRRCGRLYVFQTLMAVVTIATIRLWRQYWPVPVDFLEPELAHGLDSLWRVMLLQALPGNLNILPLYIVLLGVFAPLCWVLRRVGPWPVLAASGALWAVVNFDPSLNFPNWLDPDGWYFDPLAWQFLFVLGACASILAGRHGGSLPRWRVLAAACWAYLVFSAVESFPWMDWGLPDVRPMATPWTDKMVLSPLRLLDVLCLFYLVQSSTLATRWAQGRVGQLMAMFGRHSLEVFTLGTIIDLYGRLVFTSFGVGWGMQVAINVVGFALLWGMTRELDRRRALARAARRA
ncbi:OpgC domain-containing protein [Gluconacetobacter entanii]|uniref:OpgC family protein n=2 Tax=Gluconacetobacter entanii TaxID=108528 RepID=UPI001C934A51|nr:OpgC domain-containing protein [Gluconacetobacter entanii]MBY4638932.1 OpgC domain-containing protein [Gluconacetobacter entanii]MCW4580072.1 OpgC domain-containing protein [Gluconacetobacter entanii]MCW4583459.1 OpgC domain-containing protein [Gluconacetobacter entanii]